MSQHDYDIANGSGATVRGDINNALGAIATNNSGASAPSTTFAFQWWADTTADLLKIRNAANSAWITVGTLSATNLGLLSLAGGTMTGTLTTNGQVAFPASQNASSNANTLDDYEEGTWTPVLTFATPGNLSVAYSQQSGFYIKVGQLVSISWTILTSTFTHTTASGNSQVTGVPFVALTGLDVVGALGWQGITRANYTDIVAEILGAQSSVLMLASGSGQGVAQIAAGDMPTAGTVLHRGELTYRASA